MVSDVRDEGAVGRLDGVQLVVILRVVALAGGDLREAFP